MAHYDISIKTLLIGDSGVGKSSILLQFVEEKFTNSIHSTIGVDYKTKYLDISNKIVKFLLWDTTGQERFNSITKTYYRNAQVILYVFDITDRQTWNNIIKWNKESSQIIPTDCIKILIGNKLDLSLDSNIKREVEKDEAHNFIKLNGFYTYIETSAKTNTKILECFEMIGNKCLDNLEKKNKQHDIKSNNYNKFDVIKIFNTNYIKNISDKKTTNKTKNFTNCNC